MKWKLHPVTDHAGAAYCFPALLEPLTGCTYEQACGYINAIRKINPKTPVTGVNDYEINLILRNMGLRFFCENRTNKRRMSVRNFVKTKMKKDTLYLLSLTQHVILLYNGKIIDNRTCWGPEDVEESRSAGWIVDYVYQFRGLDVVFKRKSTVYLEEDEAEDDSWLNRL